MKRFRVPIITAVVAAVFFTILLNSPGDYGNFVKRTRNIFRSEERGRSSRSLIPNDEAELNVYRKLDNRLFDLLLRMKPGIEEDESILYLAIDDNTITTIDQYPLSRTMTADGLILLKEFDPAWTLLDIEFVDRSPLGIDQDFLNTKLPVELQTTYLNLMNNNQDLVQSLAEGRIDPQFALELLDESITKGNTDLNNLLDMIYDIAVDQDAYLGRALNYLGDVSATINVADTSSSTLTEEERDYAALEFSVTGKITGDTDRFPVSEDIVPSIEKVLKSAAWAGFPRMHIDSDGIRRRIDVLYGSAGDDNFYTHMGFGTWWLRQGNGTLGTAPEIVIENRGIRVNDMLVPLDRNGKLLINYPKRLFDGTPLNRRDALNFDTADATHLQSFLELWYHDQFWDDMINDLAILEQVYGIDSEYYGFTDRALGLMAAELNAAQEAYLDLGDGSNAYDLGLLRDEFLSELDFFVTSGLKEEILADYEFYMSSPDITDEEWNDLAFAIEELDIVFDNLIYFTTTLQEIRARLRDKVTGKTVVLGYIGASTTDTGANPYEKQYMNMGIYGAVYNTLLQQEFLRESSYWMVFAVLLISSLILALLSKALVDKPGINITINASFMIVIWITLALVFIFTGYYVFLMPVILGLLATFIVTQSSNFRVASQSKASIQSSMGKVISPDLVDEIVKNPSLLNTSGETRQLTMMFTDIKGFSTISENMTSTELIDLLKRYLTPMSDIILEEKGTIDKYEGDAIIAFWNAPLDQPDHAHRACRAAMRMVKAELKLNEELMAEGIIDAPLFTRIGINTGECNVGFIGTEERRDYTALGDEMNLAARLEGVNKAYGTRVLVSSSTEEPIHSYFITRMLDRVRVVGKKQPVTLYELSYFKKYPEHYYEEDLDNQELDLKNYYKDIDQSLYLNDFSDKERGCFNEYREALKTFFPGRDWKKAGDMFNVISEKLPEDGPSKVFIDRCKRYEKKPPRKDWDGVYKLESK